MADDGWTVVGAPRQRKAEPKPAVHKQHAPATPSTSQPAHHAPCSLPGWSGGGQGEGTAAPTATKRRKKGPRTAADQLETCKTMVHDCIQDVRGSRVYGEVVRRLQEASSHMGCSECMDSIDELVIYGLGSIEDHRVSRFQLAMGVLLQQLLPKLQGPPLLYDPAFSELDMQLLRSFKMDTIADNEEGRRTVQHPTLFYLAHCEGWLCENLVAANWSASQLSQVVILGNSFGTYHQRWGCSSTRPSSGQRPDKMLHLVEQGAVVELPVKDFAFHVMSAFNDLSLHVFPADKLLQAGLPA